MAKQQGQESRQEREQRRNRARRALAALLRRVRQVCGRIQDLDRMAGEVADIVSDIRAFLEDDQLGSLVPQYERERLLEAARQFEDVYARLHQAAEICRNLQDALELADRALPATGGRGLPTRLALIATLVVAAVAVVVAALYWLGWPSGGGDTPGPDGAPAVARVNFGADDDTLSPGSGITCTNLWWETNNASAVFLQGREVDPGGSEEVCPGETTTFSLTVVSLDGSKAEYTQTIFVTEDQEPPEIVITIDPPSPTPNDRILIRAIADDPGSGVAVVEIYLAGELVEHCEATGRVPAGQGCEAVVGPFDPGSREVTAVAFDGAGNEGAGEALLEVVGDFDSR